jgi:hypothetical protein
MQAHPLACDGVLVFEASPAGGLEARAERGGQLLDGVDRGESPLLDPEVEVLARTARQVCGQLLHLEVFRGRLQAPFDAGRAPAHERQRGKMCDE